jgi:hypothetical protein
VGSGVFVAFEKALLRVPTHRADGSTGFQVRQFIVEKFKIEDLR